jgi:hypothetical protein
LKTNHLATLTGISDTVHRRKWLQQFLDSRPQKHIFSKYIWRQRHCLAHIDHTKHNFYLKMVGFEPGSSVPVADAMTTAPRHYQGYQVSLIKKSPKM